MKTRTLLYIAAVALLAGCQREVMPEKGAKSGSPFLATMEEWGTDTKTYVDYNYNVRWEEGDQVGIFVGSDLVSKYQVSDGSDGRTSVVLDLVEGPGQAGTELHTNVAFYPYDSNLGIESVDGSNTDYVIHSSLAQVQNYVAGSFASGSFPMVAITDDENDYDLNFKNAAGVLEFSLKGTEVIKHINISGNDGEILWGDIDVYVSNDGSNPVTVARGTDEANKVAVLKCDPPIELSEDVETTFKIVIPPTEFKNGFKIVTVDIDDNLMERKTTDKTDIKRNSVLGMPVVPYDPTTTVPEYYTDGILPGSPEPASDYSIIIMAYDYDGIYQKSLGKVFDLYKFFDYNANTDTYTELEERLSHENPADYREGNLRRLYERIYENATKYTYQELAKMETSNVYWWDTYEGDATNRKCRTWSYIMNLTLNSKNNLMLGCNGYTGPFSFVDDVNFMSGNALGYYAGTGKLTWGSIANPPSNVDEVCVIVSSLDGWKAYAHEAADIPQDDRYLIYCLDTSGNKIGFAKKDPDESTSVKIEPVQITKDSNGNYEDCALYSLYYRDEYHGNFRNAYSYLSTYSYVGFDSSTYECKMGDYYLNSDYNYDETTQTESYSSYYTKIVDDSGNALALDNYSETIGYLKITKEQYTHDLSDPNNQPQISTSSENYVKYDDTDNKWIVVTDIAQATLLHVVPETTVTFAADVY